jgi:hypothetical protein
MPVCSLGEGSPALATTAHIVEDCMGMDEAHFFQQHVFIFLVPVNMADENL